MEATDAGAPSPVTEQALSARYDGKPAISSFRGEASYYGASFEGRKTASGERYESRGFTAAHRTLPFGTVVRVQRLDLRRTVYVRITDRGPFGSHHRVIDLSRAAAEALGILRRGVAEVQVDVVELGSRKNPRRKR